MIRLIRPPIILITLQNKLIRPLNRLNRPTNKLIRPQNRLIRPPTIPITLVRPHKN